MTIDHGRSASPSGHSQAEPEEVSALRASVPNAALFAKFSAWLAYVKDEAEWAPEPEIGEYESLLALARSGVVK